MKADQQPTRSKPVRVADIAGRLGVSSATVSLAFSGSKLIKPATRDRVLRVARQMHYVPDLQARTLRTGRSNRIAVICPTIENPFYLEKVNLMQRLAREAGYELAFACTDWDRSREEEACLYFLAQNVDALIVSSLSSRETLKSVAQFTERGRPVCVLDVLPEPATDISSVTVDRTKGMAAVTQLLIDLGHRSFAFAGSLNLNHPNHRSRWEGIEKAFRSTGLEPSSIVRISPERGNLVKDGFELMERFVATTPRSQLPTAILAHNDVVAIGILSCLHSHGIRVPQEVSVVGFDGIEMSAYSIPPLTTVSQNPAKLGELAIKLVLDQLKNGGNGSPLRQHVTHNAELIVRESTGPPRKD